MPRDGDPAAGRATGGETGCRPAGARGFALRTNYAKAGHDGKDLRGRATHRHAGQACGALPRLWWSYSLPDPSHRPKADEAATGGAAGRWPLTGKPRATD